jgi:hypothetical protein
VVAGAGKRLVPGTVAYDVVAATVAADARPVSGAEVSRVAVAAFGAAVAGVVAAGGAVAVEDAFALAVAAFGPGIATAVLVATATSASSRVTVCQRAADPSVIHPKVIAVPHPRVVSPRVRPAARRG